MLWNLGDKMENKVFFSLIFSIVFLCSSIFATVKKIKKCVIAETINGRGDWTTLATSTGNFLQLFVTIGNL